jgi:hypothetical protein
MKSFLSLACLLLSLQSIAGLKVKIIDIIEGDDFLLLANNGLVYELTTTDRDVLDFAYYAKENKLEVEIIKPSLNLDSVFDNREIVRTIKLDYTPNPQVAPKKVNKSLLNIPTPLDNYEVSSVSSNTASDLFLTMRTDTRNKSQCYNRAHVWTYELSQKTINGSKLNLGKTFLFFTRKYIREYRYKWWFHVSPYIKADSELRVMDRKFTRGPLPLQKWTDIFMHNDAKCKVVEFYDDYRNNQDVEYCYIIKSSMYYWQPLHIEGLEDGDAEPKSWHMQQMNIAYRNAIGRWSED